MSRFKREARLLIWYEVSSTQLGSMTIDTALAPLRSRRSTVGQLPAVGPASVKHRHICRCIVHQQTCQQGVSAFSGTSTRCRSEEPLADGRAGRSLGQTRGRSIDDLGRTRHHGRNGRNGRNGRSGECARIRSGVPAVPNCHAAVHMPPASFERTQARMKRIPASPSSAVASARVDATAFPSIRSAASA